MDGTTKLVRRKYHDRADERRLSHLRQHSGYGYRFGIAIPLQSANVNGLPSPDENQVLGQIEERLKVTLERQAESLLVGVITTRNMKECVFYTRDPEQVRRKVDDVSGSINSHRIQLIIERDSDWSVYRLLS